MHSSTVHQVDMEYETRHEKALKAKVSFMKMLTQMLINVILSSPSQPVTMFPIIS